MAQDTKFYFNHPIDHIARSLGTDLQNGLTLSQVKDRTDEQGYNELPVIKKSLLKIYLAPIFNFLILILLISGILILILGSPGSTIITFTVVAINSITVIIQQFRAQKALESLKKIAALKASVVREGIQFEIPTRELVSGDLILLTEGDKIPADGRIVEAINMSVNEAPLTGESEAVEKDNEVLLEKKIPIQKQINMIFMGTYVHTGRGKALVTAIGKNTEIGKISTQLNEMGTIEDIPLRKKLNRLGYILGTIVIVTVIILIIYKLSILAMEGLLFGSYVTNALSSSILRSMGVIPINLPLLSTLILVTGVLEMAESGVIIKNLSAIESLGRVSIICTDKTGTLTKGDMTVNYFWINGIEYNVSGSGYEEDGKIYHGDDIVDLRNNPTFRKFIQSCVLNNNARLIFEDVKIKARDYEQIAVRKALGSPTEASLLVLAEKANYIIYDIKKQFELVQEFSFNSKLKLMSSIYKKRDNEELFVFTKGAPERILDLCTYYEKDGAKKKISVTLKNELIGLINLRAKQGYRTLAIAYKAIEGLFSIDREEIEHNLIFLGFTSILDPPRPGVREAVSICESGGIKTIMVTGDHPSTAKTIASQLRIYKLGDNVAEGYEINELKLGDFNNTTVFARVEPQDKEIIVKRYQDQEKICAMTGDGINDTLALKMANCGIAMGITGTDVAKEAADMIISDDNFNSIAEGVRIGRGIFSKIRIMIYFFICLNIMEASIFFFYEFFPFVHLFSSNWQQLYIFAIVHSFPSLGLVVDGIPKDVMKDPPRNTESLLNKRTWMLLLVQAFLIGLGLVLVFQITLGGGIPLNQWNLNPYISYFDPSSSEGQLIAQKARTMFITTLYIAETMFVWTFRRPNMSLIKSIKEEFNYYLAVACLFTLGLHILNINFSYQVNYFINDSSGLNFQINFMFLSFEDWLLCILFATPGIFGFELIKYVARLKQIKF